jgi:hypothetical protein
VKKRPTKNLLLLLAALLAGPLPSRAQPSPAQASPLPFSPGEQIDLAVAWLKVPTGRARITVGAPEGTTWPIILQSKTDGVAKLFDLRQQMITWWDPATRQSLGSDLEAVELGYHHADRVRFDRGAGKATVVVQAKSRSETTVSVPRDVHDLVSAYLSLRLHPLQPGDRVDLPVFTGSKDYTLEARVLGRERVETPAGPFPTVKVQVNTAFDGKFESKRDMFLWFTDDARHVLVRASAEFVVGSMVAQLTAYRPGRAPSGLP